MIGIIAMMIIRGTTRQKKRQGKDRRESEGPSGNHTAGAYVDRNADSSSHLHCHSTPIVRRISALSCSIFLRNHLACRWALALLRSHADLGINWSISLELRENHRLVTCGVYRRIQHPMYTAIFLQAIAQALLLPNWLAGPACLIAFLFMLPLRIRPEESMMLEKFGGDYVSYIGRTKRLIPSVW
jgi:protein-S-isoprenylcysteine O-methyltransferase Ste14